MIQPVAEVRANILRDHGQECETYKVAMEYSSREDLQRWLGNAYLNMLEKEHDYRISDEAVKETLIANEYEFLANGEIFYERKYDADIN